MLPNLKEDEAMEAIHQVASRFGYEVSNIDVTHVSKSFKPMSVGYQMQEDRKIAIKLYLTEAVKPEEIFRNLGHQLALQYYHDNDPKIRRLMHSKFLRPFVTSYINIRFDESMRDQKF